MDEKSRLLIDLSYTAMLQESEVTNPARCRTATAYFKKTISA